MPAQTWSQRPQKKLKKDSPWKLGGLSVMELAKRVWSQIKEDEVFGRAAQLSYYFLLALFPALLFMITMLGFIAKTGTELREKLLSYFQTVLPANASALVTDTVQEVIGASGGGKISFGILATLWAASNGMGAITNALNVAYEVEETRPWWKARLVAITLTISLSILIISAIALVLYGFQIGSKLAEGLNLGRAFEIAWSILQWPAALSFMFLAFAIIYYWAPNLAVPSWRWITPGAAAGVTLWVVASLAFRFYLRFFDSYSKTYGSLGAVIILMLWLYFTGLAVLVGGEINSEIERASRGTTKERKAAEHEKIATGRTR